MYDSLHIRFIEVLSNSKMLNNKIKTCLKYIQLIICHLSTFKGNFDKYNKVYNCLCIPIFYSL